MSTVALLNRNDQCRSSALGAILGVSCSAQLNCHASDSAEYCSILPIATRARVARRDWVGAALRFLQRSAEDSGETLHADDHSVRRYGRAPDDHSAAAVLCVVVGWYRYQCSGLALVFLLYFLYNTSLC